MSQAAAAARQLEEPLVPHTQPTIVSLRSGGGGGGGVGGGGHEHDQRLQISHPAPERPLAKASAFRHFPRRISNPFRSLSSFRSPKHAAAAAAASAAAASTPVAAAHAAQPIGAPHARTIPSGKPSPFVSTGQLRAPKRAQGTQPIRGTHEIRAEKSLSKGKLEKKSKSIREKRAGDVEMGIGARAGTTAEMGEIEEGESEGAAEVAEQSSGGGSAGASEGAGEDEWAVEAVAKEGVLGPGEYVWRPPGQRTADEDNLMVNCLRTAIIAFSMVALVLTFPFSLLLALKVLACPTTGLDIVHLGMNLVLHFQSL